MNANKIFQEEQLPQRFLGFSSCFRREAGSYGKDTKGILRSHQFDKIEMLSICTESQSLKEQDLFIDLETKLMEDLVLPYRIVQTAVKNLSRPSARSFDIEC
jgi:seryl-tRNA synthetase